MFVSKSIGLAFQRRSTTGAASENTAADAATAPEWLRLEPRRERGDRFYVRGREVMDNSGQRHRHLAG